MEQLAANPILDFHLTTLEDIRKCWDLDGERIKQSVDLLEAWVTKQNHFVNKKFNRHYLEFTLVTCKGSVEKSKSQIDKLCTWKTLLPKFFIACNVRQRLADILNMVWVIPLPKLTKDHYRGYIIKINTKEFSSTSFMKFYQLCMIICEYLKRYDYANGFIIIEDFMDASIMDIVTKVNLVEFQRYMSILVEGYGARLRGVHMLSDSKVIDVLVKTFKPILPAKIGDRIEVHHNAEDLHRVIDKDLLPVEYGGKERSMEELKEKWLDVICTEEFEKYLAEMMASCTDESLRTTDKFNEQHIGLPGSFRTLTVD